MDISKFFETLAQYLNFFFDFLLLRGFDKYTRVGSINSELVSYFVVGVFAAYVISSIKRVPGYEQMYAAEESSGTTETTQVTVVKTSDGGGDFKMDMAGFVLLSIAGGIVFHCFLVVYHKIFPLTEIGNIKDSLNAVFAVNAVYNPLNAILKHINRGGKLLAKLSPGCALFAAGLMFVVSGIYFFTIFYWIYAFAAVHGTTRKYMLGPSGILAALGLALGVLIAVTSRRASVRNTKFVVLPSENPEAEVTPNAMQTPGN
jgi:hypothetical protein